MVDRTQIHVHLVGAGPGDPGLITVRGIECLQKAEIVIYDRLVNPILLQYAPNAEWIDAGKQPDHHPLPQGKINELLVEKALEGKRVVRLKGGDPYVFGRGGEEAIALVNAGIPFEIVPGITSAIAAPAYAGIPVTHRGVSQSVSFITGHSAKDDDLPEEWSCLAGSDGTLVFLMGVHNLPQITRQLLNGGRHPQTPIAIIEKGTCSQQKTVTGTLENIVEKAKEIQPPSIIIVGEVVRLRETLQWYDKPATCPLLGVQIGLTQPIYHPSSEHVDRQRIISQSTSYGLDDFAWKLSLLGAMPVQMPGLKIRISPNADQFRKILLKLAKTASGGKEPSWILFCNPETVSCFFKQLSNECVDVRILSDFKIGVIGEAAAENLKQYLLYPDMVINNHEVLYPSEQLTLLSGQKIILLLTEPILPELKQALLKLKVEPIELPFFISEDQPLSSAASEALIRGDIELLTFLSPAAVHGFTRAFQRILPADSIHYRLRNSTIACIDEITAQTALNIGLKVNIIPDEASTEAMISAIIAWKRSS